MSLIKANPDKVRNITNFVEEIEDAIDKDYQKASQHKSIFNKHRYGITKDVNVDVTLTYPDSASLDIVQSLGAQDAATI